MPGSQATNKEENKNVITQIAQEAGKDKDHIKKNVDKIHLVAAPKDRKQARIIKFTTDNFKECILMA